MNTLVHIVVAIGGFWFALFLALLCGAYGVEL